MDPRLEAIRVPKLRKPAPSENEGVLQRILGEAWVAQGDLAHTLGIYRNKGKTPELTGPIKESGY